MSAIDKDSLPEIGVGLSVCPGLEGAIQELLGEVDCLEVILENVFAGFVDPGIRNAGHPPLPLFGHGISASIGALQAIDLAHLQRVDTTARQLGCLWFSEHVAYTHSGSVDVGQLMPVQFSPCNLEFMARKIRTVTEALQLPFLIENIPYYFEIPGSSLPEVEFLVGLLEATSCGLLLDLNNLYANATNHGFDPYRFIDRLPATAVVEIHIAGGETRDGVFIDTHGHPVNAEVLAMLDYAVATKRPKAVVLEREKNFPPAEQLLAEVHELRRIWARHSPAGRRRPGRVTADNSAATELI